MSIFKHIFKAFGWTQFFNRKLPIGSRGGLPQADAALHDLLARERQQQHFVPSAVQGLPRVPHAARADAARRLEETW